MISLCVCVCACVHVYLVVANCQCRVMAHTKNGTAYFESNPNLGTLEEDKLYHIGYSTDEDLAAIFGDVKVHSGLPVVNL